MSYSIQKAAREYLEIKKQADILAQKLLEIQGQLIMKGCELSNLEVGETFVIIEDSQACKFTMDVEDGGVQSIEWIELIS